MRTMFRIALGGLLAAVVTLPAAAQDEQDELISFDQVYNAFAGKHNRAALQAMQVVSLEFRKELGRCHDEDIGGRMMQTEPRIDALGSKIANGGITSTAALAKEFADYDRLLAEHHHQLAAEGLAKPRASRMSAVARDLSFAAQYLVRAGRWQKEPLSADAQKAVDEARAAAQRLAADPATSPPEVRSAIDALGRALKRPARAS